MTVQELRRKYLEFFESKGHLVHPSGSLVPVDVTGRLDESLLFNGAGMVQFKPYFRGTATPPKARLTSAQKCLRTGDIEEVGDDSHLTFFEMLGNFSFGDYFKAEAIAYSWEFLTAPQWLSLNPQRLAFTVFQEDDEAYELWANHLKSASIDPETRLFRLGEDTNYWPAGAFSKGPPGPCGPNSEMFFWTGPEAPPEGPYTKEDYLRDEAQGKWLEIWNDVFIQYEWQGQLRDPNRPGLGYDKMAMPNLPFRSIDTGMGIERTVAVLNGYRSVYDTDAFRPLLAALAKLQGDGLDNGVDDITRAKRVIADHLRAAVFCVADGILPSNTGRGYVLRRLLRRAVLKGTRVLGFKDNFLHLVTPTVIDTFGSHYTELLDRQATIIETLRNEETQFRRTLEAGSQILAEQLLPWKDGRRAASTPFPGDVGFQLYDTYGFPLEVTQEICAEAGVTVDLGGYEVALQEAQERSRAASGMDTVYGGVAVLTLFTTAEATTPTKFLGYHTATASARITGAHPIEEDGEIIQDFVVALDETPFYAEAGGQVSDTGRIVGDGFHLDVLDVTKQDGVYIHLVRPSGVDGYRHLPLNQSKEQLNAQLFNKIVKCQIDAERRAHIVRNHTATHLLHAALRHVLGEHVTQAGSLVAHDHLRFDFTHGAALSAQEIAEVEQMVHRQILAGQTVLTYENLPISEARAMGAMALFGEKYGEFVRLVQIGDMPPGQPSFSRELCGGIHVQNTGQIGLFKIQHEASAASGVRRITALTGDYAFAWVNEQQSLVAEAAAKLKSTPRDLLLAIDKTLEALRDERKKREKLAQKGAGSTAQEYPIGPVVLRVQQLDDADLADAKAIADRLVEGQPNGIALVVNTADGKVLLVCKVGSVALQAGAKAGEVVREAAKATGGGGGGKPEFATAGGKEPSQIPAAIEAVRQSLARLTVSGS